MTSAPELLDRLERAAMSYERLGKATRDNDKTRELRKGAMAELAAARTAISDALARRAPVAVSEAMVEKVREIRARAALEAQSAEKAGVVGAAVQLAELVLSMGMAANKGQAARQLARQVLGQARIYPDVVAITTNGTTRVMPAAEPVFLIRGQDAVAGDAVRAWASLAEANGARPDIVSSAREHAVKMDAWPTKKVPDLAPASPSPATGEAS